MKQTSCKNPSHTRNWLLGGLGALAIAGVAAGVIYPSIAANAAANPPIPESAALSNWKENGADGRYVLQMLEGSAPTGVVTGKVLSDTQCTPDEQGINHCHNEISLPDGTTITVIDNHSMMVNRCLNPGDRLTLEQLETGWIVGTLANPSQG
ncbi:hypothetical protein C8N35_11348 [Breoghania corrubedonensis]|uniref:Uncharacterized protein n=1 Tax=Breoghania corrubedonensis TaxID=665038 RepID=A0A2T5UU05_9HYPH|nr:hypothetical protein [Breoghania corrubedonensis]PTW55007.1 hypothetical protein C8N35_11348 [Breoghania corrubedonensis]